MGLKSLLAGDLGRYFAALLGSAGSSGAQFLLTLVLLKGLAAEQFGQFTFLWLAAQFIWALGGALFSAPLARIVSQSHAVQDPAIAQATTWMQLCFGVASMIGGYALASRAGQDSASSLAYAALVLVGGLRLYGRVASYAHARQKAVVTSDGLFTICVLVLTALLYFVETPGATVAYLILGAGNLSGVIALFRSYGFGLRFPGVGPLLQNYRHVWSRYSSWSLLGVIATETTANAHSYIVTFVLGPAAFGPIAASSVLIRPAVVGLNALSEFERARMARITGSDQQSSLRRARRLFRTAAFAFWVVTAVFTYCVLTYASERMFGPGYARNAVLVGAWLWTALLLIRVLYLPETTEMQSHGAFAELAWPRIWSAPFSICGVILLLQVAQPVWSLVAICLGELISGILLLGAHRKVSKRFTT